MYTFKAKIQIIGVNPYVLLPARVLKNICLQAGKDKGTIPIQGTLYGHPFKQTLLKYSGKWRLYLNTPMRKSAGIDVGDMAEFAITFDAQERTIPMHPKLKKALAEHIEAKAVFDKLSPSKQKEIVRYIHALKQEETVDRNILRAIAFLKGEQRFIGRDKP